MGRSRNRLLMTYEVKTAVFEGPLDLLLQLITRHQLDITRVSLLELVTEYLSYLQDMRKMDLDVTSEFLLIAATLIQLKARHLLPDDREIDMDEELGLLEERDRLLARLLACVTFKDVAAVLAQRMGEMARHLPRTVGLDQNIPVPEPDVRITVTAEEFAAIAVRATAPRPTDPDTDHFDLDLPSVNDAVGDLRARVAQEIDTTFDDLVEHCNRRVEVVAYFLALLELARWGAVELSQTDWLSTIAVRHRETDLGAATSEWA
ncbi:MAG: segregation/condensation protein A [Acidimicrobiia bacterium]|nr:segregation/condensation protein A [Acidimicrobiia bacterium]